MRPYNLSHERLSEIIDGMEMDLRQSRYLDFTGLRLYCHRVAGVVGLLAAGIFGYGNPRTLEYAERLGLAFQRQPQRLADGGGQPARQPVDRAEVEDAQAPVVLAVGTSGQQTEVPRVRVGVQQTRAGGAGEQEARQELTGPVALFRCEKGLVSQEMATEMADLVAGHLPVVDIPDAGHHPMLDRPLSLVTGVRTLLAVWP